jgi:hypothetical protein
MGVRKDKTTGACTFTECRFIKSNGLKCQSPAMRGSQFCYFHGRTRIYVPRPRSREPIQLPPLQNQASIHAALDQVIQALASGNLDTKRAGSLFYALQMAQQTVHAAPYSPPVPQPPLTTDHRSLTTVSTPPAAAAPASS